MLVDLHTHSTASDGVLSPPQLLERARAKGVALLALTDHDSVDGVRALAANAESSPVALVPGIEVSTAIGAQAVHVLGLWIDSQHSALEALIDRQRARRERRAEAIGLSLEKAGISGAFHGARALAGDAPLSRPHFARYLVDAGHCSSEQQAFRRWLGKGKRCDVACEWPAADEVVDVIHSAGGTAVLAHPLKYRLTRRRLDALLAAFRDAGGDALELVSGAQPEGTVPDLLKLGQRNQLGFSTGSDFHNPAHTWCDLGGQQALPPAVRGIWESRC